MSSGARKHALEALPGEILGLIVEYLPTQALKQLACVSKALNPYATGLLWRSVCLVDQRKLHMNDNTENFWSGHGPGELDEHDDSPIVQKLYLLATQERLACKVQVLTHRCHLPSPHIFSDLNTANFYHLNISQDARLRTLLRLAIRNMTSVHTLRIVHGHMNVTNELVAGFLDHDRPRKVPLRKLWLESCCLSVTTTHFLEPACTTGLESIRLRRLAITTFLDIPSGDTDFLGYSLSRGGQRFKLHNGAGGWVVTTIRFSEQGLQRWPPGSALPLVEKAKAFDAAMWDKLPAIRDFIDANDHLAVDHRALDDPINPMAWVLKLSESTLTSLNLDWILWRRQEDEPRNKSAVLFSCLSTLRFPHLRAFQIRNAVLPLTKLPKDVFLLQDNWLEFMEAHPKIQCLAWPIDRFYRHGSPSADTQSRARHLVSRLATMLVSLRMDCQYANQGEPVTDLGLDVGSSYERLRRRRFIEEFAPHMKAIEHIKLEGGFPRDEKREILRALHACPLKRIVMIGVAFPVGNTWGAQGQRIKDVDPGQPNDVVYNLDAEHITGEAPREDRSLAPIETPFVADYGWPPQPPLLQTIAQHHAATVTELKICGYNGCPILSYSNPVTHQLLTGLRFFHNLDQLVISFWLLTWFESSYRDTDIIQSWIDKRSPSSTALVIVTPPRRSSSPESPVEPGQFPFFDRAEIPPRGDFNRWAVMLKTQFSSSALAYRVASDIGKHLSPQAKDRPGGVRVRASFCLGARETPRAANDIFDLGMRIGKDNQVLEFVGPREEGEKGRWWSKLESRRWF